MGAGSSFTTGNYPRQPAGASSFVNYVEFSISMGVKSELNKDVSSTKMSESFATVKVLIEYTFFVFSPFMFLLAGSQGCTMFLLE